MAIVHLQTPKVQYKAHHPLYGNDNVFKSWMELSEKTIDIAGEEAERRLKAQWTILTSDIADEMIASVKEIPLEP